MPRSKPESQITLMDMRNNYRTQKEASESTASINQIKFRFPDYPLLSLKSRVADLMFLTIKRLKGEGRPVSRAYAVKCCEREFRSLIGVWIAFGSNTGGGERVAAPLGQQQKSFRALCFQTYLAAAKAVETFANQNTNAQITGEAKCVTCGKKVNEPSQKWFTEAQQCAICYRIKKDEAETAQMVEPEPKGSSDPMRAHKEWSQSVREFCEQRDASGKKLWDWSMRNTHDGMALIAAGINPYAVRDACTMHFDDDVRRQLGVDKKYDFVSFGIAKYLELGAKARVPLKGGVYRSVSLMMVGPMGSGKSTAAKMLADSLGIPYGKVSMTRGTSPSAFNGRPRVADDGSLVGVLSAIGKGEHDFAKTIADEAMAAGDVTVSQWVKIYTGGGVFLFDEIDAADSNLLLIVNDALSSSEFANAATGKSLARSDKFLALAAGNTLALGADDIYGGREKLDGASLDRWASGRIRVGYDIPLENSICEQMISEKAAA